MPRRIGALELPQRPDASVAARYAAEIAGRDANVLLLGVTRELAALGERLTVVDWNREQLDLLWPQDPPGRETLLADWRTMQLPRQYTAALGDGCLSTLVWPHGYREALGSVADALLPGGRLVVRCYVAPDTPETLEQVVSDVTSGREPSFHATRWRFAMAVAGSSGNVAVADIFDAFEEAFPDRLALSERTGWSLSTTGLMDVFRDSRLVYSFVTRQRLLDALPAAFVGTRFVSSGDYPLSERCPLLVAERAA